MIEREQDFDDDREHDDEENGLEAHGFELEDPSEVFLSMRGQNVELLKVAVQIAGYDKNSSPLKPNEIKTAIDNIWKIYSEIYDWVDPEEIEDEEDEEDV